jgi:hypothetical protein
MWGKHHDDAYVFGPGPSKTNVHLNCPQVALHGMGEGLTIKLNFGALHLHAIAVLKETHPKLKTTITCRRTDRQVLINANFHHAANKNVEFGGLGRFQAAFITEPRGVFWGKDALTAPGTSPLPVK